MYNRRKCRCGVKELCGEYPIQNTYVHFYTPLKFLANDTRAESTLTTHYRHGMRMDGGRGKGGRR